VSAQRRTSRCRRYIPVPGVFEVGGCLQDADRRWLNYQSIGSGGGIKQIKRRPSPSCVRQAAGSPPSLKESGWCSPDDHRRCRAGREHQGRQGRRPDTGRCHGRQAIYLGEITSGMTRRSRRLQPEMTLPDTAICAVQRSTARNQLPVHRLPVEVEPEVQGDDRATPLGAVADRHRCQAWHEGVANMTTQTDRCHRLC